MLANKLTWLMVLLVGSLVGCAQSPQTAWNKTPLAVPYQPTIQQQIQLARIEQLLQRDDLNQETLAQVYYERGLLHDGLGLRDLARLDFNQSLSLQPNQPDVFNILGVYFTQSAHFDAAYEAFDSTLELNFNHPFALRNRGIALYYGGRYELAHDDLMIHYQEEINDPYRVIWLFLVELEINQDEALQKLRRRYEMSDKENWGWELVRLYLSDISEQALLDEINQESENNVILAERLTEAYFYLGKMYHYNGDFETATQLYKLALAGNVYEFVEHRYSTLELSRIAKSVAVDLPEEPEAEEQ